jgi:hypothetical protein
VLLDFDANFFRKAGQFGCQQSGYAERFLIVSNAVLPVPGIYPESFQRIVNLVSQRLCPL